MSDYQKVTENKIHRLQLNIPKQRLQHGSVCELEPTLRIILQF